MVPNDNEKPHGLDDVTKKLYSRDEHAIPQRRPSMLHEMKRIVSTAWTNERKEKAANVIASVSAPVMHTSFFKKFFVASSIFFLVALSIGAYLFFVGGRSVSSDNVSINVLGNAFTPGGEKLDLTLEISNRNAIPLELADLIIEYPKSGTNLTDNPSDITRLRESVGTIPAGKVVNHKTSLVLYGNQGSTKQIQFTLEFHVPGSNAIFQRQKLFVVTVSSSPITLNVSAPQTTITGQEYSTTITLSANTSKSISDMVVRVDYPTGFKFNHATPAPAYLSNVWSIGTIEPGKPISITISGVMAGEDGEERSFRIYAGERSKDDKNAIGIVYQSALSTVDIVRPFIEADLVINGQRTQDIVIRPHALVNVEIPWSNNMPVSVLDAQIKATISGDLIDGSTIQPRGGFFNSAENTIVWNRDTDETFGALTPGEHGVVGFSFSTYSLYRNNQLADKPTINITVSISGKQPQEGNFLQLVNNVVQRTAKFTTDFTLSGQAYYTSGPFVNTGPLPPKANQKTTYTIRWALTSSANNVRNVVVKGALPAYVHFLGQVSPGTEDVSLDPITGEVTWNVGTVARGSGLTTDSEPRLVFFQVELIPSTTQIGSAPVLVKETIATGVDSFTGAPVSATWREITTRILNDSGSFQGIDQVVP